MSKIRFRYSKTGKSKYISHLDFTASVQRAFLRAGVKLKYSEGFNPHPYISVALPLSVGCESVCELMDVAVIDINIPNIKKISLQEGIVLQEIYEPVQKFSDIAWIEVIAKLYYDMIPDNALMTGIIERFSEKSIVISKKTKRGTKDIDIAPYIKDQSFSPGDSCVIMNAKIFAQNPSITHIDIENVLKNDFKPKYTRAIFFRQ